MTAEAAAVAPEAPAAIPTLDEAISVGASRHLDMLVDRYLFGAEETPYPPPYSRSLVHAWRIVTELEKRGYWYRLDGPRKAGRQVRAGFTPHGTHGSIGVPAYAAYGDTLPEAICKSALLLLRHTATEERP